MASLRISILESFLSGGRVGSSLRSSPNATLNASTRSLSRVACAVRYLSVARLRLRRSSRVSPAVDPFSWLALLHLPAPRPDPWPDWGKRERVKWTIGNNSFQVFMMWVLGRGISARFNLTFWPIPWKNTHQYAMFCSDDGKNRNSYQTIKLNSQPNRKYHRKCLVFVSLPFPVLLTSSGSRDERCTILGQFRLDVENLVAIRVGFHGIRGARLVSRRHRFAFDLLVIAQLREAHLVTWPGHVIVTCSLAFSLSSKCKRAFVFLDGRPWKCTKDRTYKRTTSAMLHALFLAVLVTATDPRTLFPSVWESLARKKNKRVNLRPWIHVQNKQQERHI